MNKKVIQYGGSLIVVIIMCYFLYHFFNNTQTVTYNAEPKAVTATSSIPVVSKKSSQYIEVIDGCNYAFVGTCVNLREGPGTKYPVHTRLRTGVVLKVGEIKVVDGKKWYKIIFAAELLYPERVKGNLYVADGEYARYFNDDGDEYESKNTATSTKRIVVDVSEEILYAYDGDVLFMKEPISTGLEFTPTPRGTFSVFKKTPARYMQGPLPGVSDQVYDLPGVPWDLYFTSDGAVIHGAYWHNHFGKPWSHGCVNLSPENAKKLYMWADIGMKVTVQK